MNTKMTIVAAALAMAFGLVHADELFRVKYSNIKEADVPGWGGVMMAFDGVANSGQDTAMSATVDLKEPLHLTRLLFHGRHENEVVNTRMRNARFLVSNDAQNWTLLYQVPSDYICPADYVEIPWPDATTSAASWRYVRWEGVNAGSMTEFQIYTDDNSFQFDTAAVEDIGTSTFDAYAIVEKYGSFVAQGATLYAAVAENDFGADFGDWQDQGVITDCGVIENDTATSVTVDSFGPGVRVYVRFFAVCGGVVRNSEALSFIPVDASLVRQYVIADANLYPSAASYRVPEQLQNSF